MDQFEGGGAEFAGPVNDEPEHVCLRTYVLGIKYYRQSNSWPIFIRV